LQLDLYARDQGQLGKGTEFTGYAAKYLPHSNDLETLNFISNPNSIDRLSEKKNVHVDLYLLDTVLLCISLFALPSFATAFVTFSYIQFLDDQYKKNKNKELDAEVEAMEEGQSLDNKPFTPPNDNIRYLAISALIICAPANAIMVFFQVSALRRKYEWFYFYPYIWLWILIIYKLFTSMSTAYKLKYSKVQFFYAPSWIEGTLLWIACMTVQLLSWHLVFVSGGLILNPLRASLYCVIILTAVICFMVLLATVIKMIFIIIISCVIILKHRQDNTDIDKLNMDIWKIPKQMQNICAMLFGCAAMWKQKDNSKMKVKFMCVPMPVSLQDKFPFINITILISLVMLLLYVCAYGVFVLQVNISGNMQKGGKLLDEVIKLIVPKLFMIALAWFATKLFLSPQKLLKHIS